MNLKSLNPKAIGAALFNPGMALGTAGFAFDQYINYKNYKLQRDQYNYERQLQQQIFAREDNATQRRVADLRAAGLSPVLAAGSAAGSGAVVSTNAPQIGKTGLPESALMMMQMVKMKKDIDVSDAQIDLIKSQTENTSNQTKIATEMMPTTRDAQVAAAQSSRASAALNSANARKALIDAINAEVTGMGSNNQWSSIIRDLTGYSNQQLEVILREVRKIENRQGPPTWLSPRWFRETPLLPPSWTNSTSSGSTRRW